LFLTMAGKVDEAAKIAFSTSTQFPQFALLHSVTCVQLRLITILGNCGCVAVASFLGVPSPSIVSESVMMFWYVRP
jgi:hypothetical protein